MVMQCPNCGSGNIQKLSVVHANGTQHIAARSGNDYIHGTNQTALAQNCAPPSPPSPLYFIGAYAFGGYVAYHTVMVRWRWSDFALGLAALAVGWLLMKIFLSLAKEYSEHKQIWQKSWLCHACGQTHVRE